MFKEFCDCCGIELSADNKFTHLKTPISTIGEVQTEFTWVQEGTHACVGCVMVAVLKGRPMRSGKRVSVASATPIRYEPELGAAIAKAEAQAFTEMSAFVRETADRVEDLKQALSDHLGSSDRGYANAAVALVDKHLPRAEEFYRAEEYRNRIAADDLLQAVLAQLFDADDYDQWLKLGRTLHAASGGSERALGEWRAWSDLSPKWENADFETRWQSFQRPANGGMRVEP